MTRGTISGSVLLAIMLLTGSARAQSPTPSQLDLLESRVTTIESAIDNLASAGLVIFLFGAFCALWAKNSGRNAWLWFFLGAFFSVITVLVLLWKNSSDRQAGGTSVHPR